MVTEKVSARTEGILVQVESIYLESHSDPDEPRYVFAYRIRISNEGTETATLVSRRWIITDAGGQIEEVQGPGVIGETPRLEPGQAHSYQSFCVLKTARGTMHGTYQMVREDKSSFDAEIPTFVLRTMDAEAKLVLN